MSSELRGYNPEIVNIFSLAKVQDIHISMNFHEGYSYVSDAQGNQVLLSSELGKPRPVIVDTVFHATRLFTGQAALLPIPPSGDRTRIALGQFEDNANLTHSGSIVAIVSTGNPEQPLQLTIVVTEASRRTAKTIPIQRGKLLIVGTDAVNTRLHTVDVENNVTRVAVPEAYSTPDNIAGSPNQFTAMLVDVPQVDRNKVRQQDPHPFVLKPDGTVKTTTYLLI